VRIEDIHDIMPSMTHTVRAMLEENVHAVLAHSYALYFVLFLAGLFFDFLFSFRIYESEVVPFVGFLLLLFATFLIVWAQKTSRRLNTAEINKEAFCRGPYCYTRMPTHWGLFLAMFGFGLVINSVFVVLFTLASFLITKMVFIRKEERILFQKYGTPYMEYKKSVKF